MHSRPGERALSALATAAFTDEAAAKAADAIFFDTAGVNCSRSSDLKALCKASRVEFGIMPFPNCVT
jgi:hypothetical protein